MQVEIHNLYELLEQRKEKNEEKLEVVKIFVKNYFNLFLRLIN